MADLKSPEQSDSPELCLPLGTLFYAAELLGYFTVTAVLVAMRLSGELLTPDFFAHLCSALNNHNQVSCILALQLEMTSHPNPKCEYFQVV